MTAPSPLPRLGVDGYTIEHIIAAPNWRAVYWNGTQHVTQRVYALAFATNPSQQEPSIMVGLTYTPLESWSVVDFHPDYCGLLPPDWDLVPFEAQNPCGHTP